MNYINIPLLNIILHTFFFKIMTRGTQLERPQPTLITLIKLMRFLAYKITSVQDLIEVMEHQVLTTIRGLLRLARRKDQQKDRVWTLFPLLHKVSWQNLIFYVIKWKILQMVLKQKII